MTDRKLLCDYLDGSLAAIDELVRRHIDMVYATARRRVGDAHADDVTQAVFVTFIGKRRALCHQENLAGWLYRATIYCCANLRKTEARRRRHEREVPPMAGPEPALMPEIREGLDAALNQLSAPDRDAVLLRHLEQNTYAQVAEQLGISEEAARKRADRGLSKLRALLERSGTSVPSASLGAVFAGEAAARAPAVLVGSTLALVHGSSVPVAIAALSKALHTMLWTGQAKIVGAIAVIAVILGGLAIPVINAIRTSSPPIAESPTAPATGPQVAAIMPPTTPESVPATQARPPQLAEMNYTHVTVDFDNATVDQAAQTFGVATNMRVKIDVTELAKSGVTLPPLSLHLHDVPLLEAVFQLARICRAYPTAVTTGQLTLRSATVDTNNYQANLGAWSVHGPFAMEVAQLDASLPSDPSSQVRMFVAFFAEPSLRIQRYPHSLTIDKFADEQGQEITCLPGLGSVVPSITGLARTTQIFRLGLPPSPGRKIALLRGTVTYSLVGSSQTIDMTDPLQSVRKNMGPLDVEILLWTRTEPPLGAQLPLYHLQVRYRRGTMTPAQWAELLPVLPLVPPKVFDETGHSISSHYSKELKENEDTLVVTFSSPGISHRTPQNTNEVSEPDHLSLVVPTSVCNVAVPFEFTNIPLP